ncbi:V0/A0 complex, 116-kDa subunit of ATPase [Trichocladium antarcticum]|uniref:V-type proton ATPase subunit a n=1 Tax=Trichocladium antarcticum TaxID=1450529 RepID=A0AAN6UHH6_9PEZI|nr:V0/A0 complex, 116-kDa subunit of ATPase [Trichocladium antarcticum]
MFGWSCLTPAQPVNQDTPNQHPSSPRPSPPRPTVAMAPAQDTPFRSADMSMVQLYISNEIGREVVNALGEIGLVQFRDLNGELSAFQRVFTQDIRRLDNVERQLRYFHAQMEKAAIPLRKLDLDVDTLAPPTTTEIDELAERSQSLEQRVSSLNESYETLKKREVELTEWRWVLREAGGFFDRAHGSVDEIGASTDNDDAPLLQDVEQHISAPEVERSFSGMNIGFVAGVIARDRVAAFERILWRTLRGNLYMNQAEIPEPLIDPTNNEAVQKNVFVIFAHGKEILAKIRQISESMGADVYNVDENSDLRRDQVHEVNARLNDVQSVLRNTQQTLEAELTQISRSLSAWMILVGKEKAVYNTLNLFSYDRARRTLIAEGWCPTHDLPLIRSTLQDVTNRAGLSVPSIINEIRTNKKPPTYLKTNKFTEAFQTIVNAYGTATYQEVNPAIPVIVTFPFLFAVMFGDFGHAVIMLSAALAMIYWEKPLKKVSFELFAMVYYGRYIALVMAIFSVYTGLIYNDVFSKSMTLFKSQWEWNVPADYRTGQTVTSRLRDPNYRYPFGLDWRWHGTENDLLFTNSYKMKMSIILGWAHMTYSLCFSYINARHFKRPVDIWGNFVPGMIFFQSIFGYLVVCIVYKWTVDWIGIGQQPPGLLNMLIYMFLQPGFVDPNEQLYRGQKYVQVALLLLAVAQVPVLLFLKPFYLRWEHNRARAKGYRGIGERSRVSALDADDDGEGRQSADSLANGGEGVAMIAQDLDEDGGEHGEEFEFGEVMIHQVIHTIEFCLNCVSHTASYLRLWALSLAHQQLSAVLWSMTMAPALKTTGIGGAIFLVVIFAAFFCLSCIVLIIMEGVSAMLHSLRLAWVESFSKFAEFSGWPFAPFSFKTMLEESEELKEYMG